MRLRHVLVALATVIPLGACQPKAETTASPHRGPVILITVDALRADAVGALGGGRLTPHLDRFAADADWVGPAVSASSWTVPSMASIFTGLQPWRHGNWHAERARLADDHETLPEVLQELGFRTTAYRSNTWLRAKFGYAQGFDDFRNLGQLKRAQAHLESLDGSPELIWIHVLPPHSPYQRWEEYADRVGLDAEGLARLPEKARAADLEAWFDPDRSPPTELLRQFRDLYDLHVAHADELVGSLLDALRSSGQWDQSLVVVTSDHGEEFGESGQTAHGGNLDRVLLEVPLLIKLPESTELRLRPRPWVANARLFATVLELVGARREPSEVGATLNSLFSTDDPPVLSELYLGNGVNRFSLVAEGRQLRLDVPFAPAEPTYWEARRRSVGIPAEPVDESALEDVFVRLRTAFLEVPPLTGATELRTEATLVDWEGDSREGADQLERRLRQAWLRWNGPEVRPVDAVIAPGVELTDEDRRSLEALGYVVE